LEGWNPKHCCVFEALIPRLVRVSILGLWRREIEIELFDEVETIVLERELDKEAGEDWCDNRKTDESTRRNMNCQLLICLGTSH
jgi:hypothetical protein